MATENQALSPRAETEHEPLTPSCDEYKIPPELLNTKHLETVAHRCVTKSWQWGNRQWLQSFVESCWDSWVRNGDVEAKDLFALFYIDLLPDLDGACQMDAGRDQVIREITELLPRIATHSLKAFLERSGS